MLVQVMKVCSTQNNETQRRPERKKEKPNHLSKDQSTIRSFQQMKKTSEMRNYICVSVESAEITDTPN